MTRLRNVRMICLKQKFDEGRKVREIEIAKTYLKLMYINSVAEFTQQLQLSR
ncbi:MAG: hypothetical protein LBU56_05470 [Rickettsiales bacterium]|nr:hypothetical protein [Rickettsiales bacterium]